MTFWDRYGKAVTALVFAIVTTAHTAYSDRAITQQEGVQIAIAFATTASVWLVPLVGWPWMKTAVAALLAALNVLATVIIGGISSGDLVELLVAVLTVLSVGLSPAVSNPPADPVPSPS